MKSYGVTMQMKLLQQYFHMVLFYVLQILGFALNFDFRHPWEWKAGVEITIEHDSCELLTWQPKISSIMIKVG